MQPEFWHERWQNQQIGFHREDVHPYLTEFWPCLKLSAGNRVFVPLCGKSCDLLWLRSLGHEVIGVEVSPLAVQQFFEENGMRPVISQQGAFEAYECEGIRILCGDFFKLTPADLMHVAGWYDRAALVALPPDMRRDYAQHLQEMLPREARGLLVAFEYPQHQMPGPPFSVATPEVKTLFGNACEVEVLKVVDILAQEPRFQAKGLTRLEEVIYALQFR